MRSRPRANVLAAELLKIRKRWMPYVLLLAMAAILALHIFLAGYLTWRNADDPFQRQEALHSFALPWSLPAFLGTAQFWGAILLGILVASSVGTEHSWGTVRQAIIRGQSRSQYLTVKLVAMAVMGGIGFFLAFGIGLAFSAIATALTDHPITLDVPGGPSLPEVALMVLRAAYGVLPYVFLAFCLSVVGRSTTLGVAGTLVYVFVEAIVLSILAGIGGHAADARALFPGHNVSAILAANRIGDVDFFSFAFRDPTRRDLPDPTTAALVVGGYCLAFVVIAFSVFQRRDIGA